MEIFVCVEVKMQQNYLQLFIRSRQFECFIKIYNIHGCAVWHGPKGYCQFIRKIELVTYYPTFRVLGRSVLCL